VPKDVGDMVDHVSGRPAAVLEPAVQVGVAEPGHSGLEDLRALAIAPDQLSPLHGSHSSRRRAASLAA
jgi:hypothetical protein